MGSFCGSPARRPWSGSGGMWRPGLAISRSYWSGPSPASGLGLTAQPYKRPKPCPDAALAPYFSWKGDLEAIAEVPAGPALFSPALADQVGRRWNRGYRSATIFIS